MIKLSLLFYLNMFKPFVLMLALFLMLDSLCAQEVEKTRNEKWREDLMYLKERFPAYDKTLTPFIYQNPIDSNKLYYAVEKNSIELFLKKADSLYKAVDRLNDEQIIIGLSNLLALSPNAHTRLYLFRVRTVFNNAPIGIFWFEDDLHIVAVPAEQKELLGAKIIAINGVLLDSVKRRVDNLISGNKSWKRYMSLYFLRSPQAMKGLSLGNGSDQLQVTVLTLKGKQQIVGIKADFVPQASTLEAWKDLSPLTTKKDSLNHVLSSTIKLPLYLKNGDKNYWYEYLDKEGVVYMHFNRTENMEHKSFKDFTANLIENLKDKRYDKFVLDLRFNTGGNNSIASGPLKELAKYLKNKKVYIITSYPTFSAGVTTAALFKWHTGAKIIGESAGDELVYLSEGGNIVLPNSKLNAHYANGLHNDVYEKGFSILPDKQLSVTFKDYLKGEDTIMKYILLDK